MKRHISYLRYVLIHKWWVFIAGRQLKVSWWQLLIHDWHKFLPSEWMPYATTFYKPDGSKQYEPTLAFNRAWNAHQKRGAHHWQHWVLLYDNGSEEELEMPSKYVREMVADWCGAGRAITGKWEVWIWYDKNRSKIRLHPRTRDLVESYIEWERVKNGGSPAAQ